MTNAAPQTGDAYLKVTGVDSYVEIASIADYSIATTGELLVSAWMRPDTLNFPRWEGTGYVYWLGKGDSASRNGRFACTIETTRPRLLRVQTGSVSIPSISTADWELAAIFRTRCREGAGFSWSASPTARVPTSIGTGFIADAIPIAARKPAHARSTSRRRRTTICSWKSIRLLDWRRCGSGRGISTGSSKVASRG